MREASFIHKNQQKWVRIEENLQNSTALHPDELASNYIELTNDLAYAQTFYPQSNTKAYLNQLAILAHQKIYRDQKASNTKFSNFIKREIPEAIFHMRKPLVYSLLIFGLAIAIGFLSAHYDDSFVRLILGNAYVDQTISSIQAGDPAAVYGTGGELGSSLAITINNVRVAFYAFTLGVFWSIGTGWILFSNGIMVGAFHYLFFKYGVLLQAMSAIWIHGTIELSVIVVAGGCGLMIGNSLLFPKSYTRLESFKRHIKIASKVLISTIPFFIIAGTLEGFVTRHYQLSIGMCVAIILASFLAIIYLYAYKPFQLAKEQNWK